MQEWVGRWGWWVCGWEEVGRLSLKLAMPTACCSSKPSGVLCALHALPAQVRLRMATHHGARRRNGGARRRAGFQPTTVGRIRAMYCINKVGHSCGE